MQVYYIDSNYFLIHTLLSFINKKGAFISPFNKTVKFINYIPALGGAGSSGLPAFLSGM